MTERAIRELALEELAEAARVLGRGMRDNPGHVRVFGSDPDHREAALMRLFTPLLKQYRPKGAILGAFSENRLVGVCAMVVPGRCKATLTEKAVLLPAVIRGNSLSVLISVLRWTSAWERRDPAEPHWHLGSGRSRQGSARQRHRQRASQSVLRSNGLGRCIGLPGDGQA